MNITENNTEGIQAPQDLDASQYEGVENVLRHQIEQGLADPLLGLSEETELQLVSLAFNDTMRFERLERVIKDAIRLRNDGEAAARRFNLGTFRRSARDLRKQIQDDNSRRAKMRERNLHLVQGGKDTRTGTEVDVDDGAATSVQAMVQAGSVFLRSRGLIDMFRPGRIWFDDFHGDYFTNWDGTDSEVIIPAQRVNDGFLLRAHCWLLMLDSKLGNSSTGNTEKAIHLVGDMDHRNEPRNWLRTLVWDKEPRLEKLLSRAYGAPDDAYHSAVGRCWFVSMAARISDPGCKVDTMPVLFGPQGKSKSTSLEIIGGPLYVSINTPASSNDFLAVLRGRLVGEIPELDAIIGDKVDNSRVKALLSTRVDTYRPPYGRTARDFKRTVVIVGTTNERGWFRDETGGRRFWPVHCAGMIDLEWLRANRDQLFAEAAHRYGEGEKWWDVPQGDQEAHIAEHYSVDPWADRLRAAVAGWRIFDGRNDVACVAPDQGAVEESKHWGTLVTTNRLATAALQLPLERQSRNTSNRIARAMRSLGWDQQSVRVKSGKTGQFIRAWVVTQLKAAQMRENEELPL